MLDFSRVRKKEQTIAELAAGLTVSDLHRLTDEMVDRMLSLIADAQDKDVTFLPQDPAANDTFTANPDEANIAWTIGHVIVHATASSEEAAALSTELARGVEIKGRSRAETPWQTVHTVAELRARLEESRRMRHSFLGAWPDQPNLTLTYTASYPGATPVNAIGRFINGLGHDDSHLGQITEIMRQAHVAVM
jgi:DinB superfamily